MVVVFFVCLFVSKFAFISFLTFNNREGSSSKSVGLHSVRPGLVLLGQFEVSDSPN